MTKSGNAEVLLPCPCGAPAHLAPAADTELLRDRFATLIIKHFGIAPYDEELKEFVDAALSAQGAAPPDADNYVAWLRWIPGEPDGEGTALELCGSDDEGAFKVYRWPAALQGAAPAPARFDAASVSGQAERPHLASDVGGDARDAARYRWLRSHPVSYNFFTWKANEALDEAVDAGILATGTTEGRK